MPGGTVVWVGAAVILGLALGAWSLRRLGTLDYRYEDERDRSVPRRPVWVVPVTGAVSAALVWRVVTSAADEDHPSVSALVLGLLLVLVTAVCAHLAAIDLDVHRLPDALMWPLLGGVVAGLGLAALGAGDPEPWFRALIAGAVCAGGYLLLALVTLLARGSMGLGLGDVKLAGVLGLLLGWFGWLAVLVGMYAGILIGGIAAGYLMVRRRAGRGDHLAFGPAMMAGAVVGLLLPQQILIPV